MHDLRLKPRISVAMCTFNGAAYLPAQLESIAAQTRMPDELVICDDGSTDGTRKILSAFRDAAPFPVTIHLNETSLGVSANFERCIARCLGDIIALADQDDIWLPQKLAVVEAAFAARPTVALVFSDADVIDAAGQSLGFRLWDAMDFAPHSRAMMRHNRAFEALLHHNVVTGATMAFRRDDFDLLLPIPSGCMHDAWIALLLSAVAEVTPIEQPLIRYRKHAAQQIGPLDFSLRGRLTRSRATGEQEYAAESRRYAAAAERLGGLGESKAGLVCRLRQKVEHLQIRGGMPSSRLRRLPSVARELLSRRYHAFSHGWKSAAKDLCF